MHTSILKVHPLAEKPMIWWSSAWPGYILCSLSSKTFVGNIICSIPKDEIVYFLGVFYSYNSNLQFTIEKEHVIELPFWIPNNKLVTDEYNKPSYSIFVLQVQTWIQYKVKFDHFISKQNFEVIAFSLSSNDLKKLHTILLKNSYPRSTQRSERCILANYVRREVMIWILLVLKLWTLVWITFLGTS